MNVPAPTSPWRRLRIPAVVLLAAVPFVFLGLFYFYPLAAILTTSLFPEGRLATESLRPLADSSYYAGVLWFTFWQATVSTLGAFVLGLPAAFVFARFRFPGKALLRAFTTLPFVLPTIVVAMAFAALIGPNGLANNVAMAVLGLTRPPVRLMNTVWIILIAHIFYNTAVVIRMVGGFWGNLDPRMGAAAAVLGAGPFQRFRTVTGPLLAPALMAAFALVFLFNFTSFGVVLILGGARFATLEVEIYRTAVRLFNLPLAAVLAMIQMVFTLLMMVVYTRLQARMGAPQQFRPSFANERRPVTWGERLFVYGTLALLGVCLVGPLLALGASSFVRAGSLTLDNYRGLFVNRTGSIFFVSPIVAVRNSLAFALATVLLSLLVGVTSAYLLAGDRRGGARARLALVLDPVFMLPLGTSAITLGLGYIIALDAPPLNLRASLAIVPLAHTLIAFPFVVRALLPVLRGLNPRLREAAAGLGASPLGVWRHVDVPILSRALVVGVVFAFTISIGEFSATLLLSRPQFPTVPVVIYRLLGLPGQANYGQAVALSVILMLATAAGFLGIENLRSGEGDGF